MNGNKTDGQSRAGEAGANLTDVLTDTLPCENICGWVRLLNQRDKDAERYRWLREHPAFETESVLSGLTPEQYDLVVDTNMHDTECPL